VTKKMLKLVAAVLALVLCASCLFTGCRNQQADPTGTSGTEAQTGKVTHTVRVKAADGSALTGIGVYVYTDSTMGELVWFAKTDANGEITFDDVTSDSYVAVLSDVPNGYVAAETYPLTGTETEIVLESSLVSGEDAEHIVVGLGDMMYDFTVTDTDGNEHTLSQMLQQKDAVVLNFWFLECQPCKAEFPFLQEAYANYSDSIEVLALNPVNTDEAAVAQYKEELGLTFPMAVVPSWWEQSMPVAAYPTTVIIDRFGKVTMVHTGSITSAKTFENLFEVFVGEDYQQQVLEKIDDYVEVEEPTGTKENPEELGGIKSFEVTVEPGQVVYLDVYKVSGMYLQIKSDNVYVLYNDKTYEPKDGKVGLTVSSPDPTVPVSLGIGNSGSKTETFKGTFSFRSGTVDNPYTLKLGDFTVKISKGNEQGVYYKYKATQDGVLTLKCLEGTAGVGFDMILYNLNSYAYRTMMADGGEDKSVSINVKKGQTVQFSMATLPDEDYNYPAGTFQVNASLSEGGEEDDVVVVEKAVYSVTVNDGAGNPMPGVTMKLEGGETSAVLTTDAAGVASVELPVGEYTATLTVPAGYTAEVTTLALTKDAPSGTFVVEEIVIEYSDYQVTVLAPDGETPVAGVMVIVGTEFAFTDANGVASFHLPTGTYSASVSGLSGEYAVEEGSYSFEDQTQLTVTLIYKPGTENNPYYIMDNPFVTERIPAGTSAYHLSYTIHGMILTIQDADAYVTYNGTTYGADANGIVRVVIDKGNFMSPPVLLIIGNAGTSGEKYTLNFTYPTGTFQNPEKLPAEGAFTTKLEEADDDGYYYSWTADQAGTISFMIDQITEGTEGDIRLTSSGSYSSPWLTEDGVTDADGNTWVSMDVQPGDELTIQVVAMMDEETWIAPASEIMAVWNFREESQPDPSVPTEPSEEPTEPSEEPTEPSEEPTEPSEEPTEPSEEPTEPTEPSVPTEPTEPEVPGDEATYVIAVTDYSGKPLSGVMVAVYSGSTLKATAATDAAGEAVVDLPRADYTVTLLGTSAYYDKTGAVLSSGKTELTIRLAGEPSADDNTYLYLCDEINGESLAYNVHEGGTHVKLGSGQFGYSTEKGITYFVFTPERAGFYRIAVADPKAELTYWGGTFNPFDMTGTLADYSGNAFTTTVQEANLGVDYVLGISGVSESVLEITRVGDPGFDPNYLPWVDYEGTWEPTAFTYEGGALTYVDIQDEDADYKLVYNEKDGYYHIGKADGPVMYVTLGTKAPYLSIAAMLDTAPFHAQYVDEKGNYVKEDYAELILAYNACADTATGVYPMTQDLYYMLQKGVEYMGWADPENPNYLFTDPNRIPLPGVNHKIAWLFACCYEAE